MFEIGNNILKPILLFDTTAASHFKIQEQNLTKVTRYSKNNKGSFYYHPLNFNLSINKIWK